MRNYFRQALVVESDEVDRCMTRRALLEYGVGEVNVAPDICLAKHRLVEGVDMLVTGLIVAGEACVPLVERLRSMRSPPRVLVTGHHAPPALLFRLAKLAEVDAYLEKPLTRQVLWRRLDTFQGTRLGSASILSGSQNSDPNGVDAADHAVIEHALEELRSRRRLTNAELEVLRCGVSGMTRLDIATERRVSVNTLKTQVRSLLRKCQATTLESLSARLRAEFAPHKPVPDFSESA